MTELDKLVALKNNIYVWSKTISIVEMRTFCINIKYDLNETETHLKIIELRKQKKSFKEISETTGVLLEQISFYLTTDPNKQWTLDDWIKGYFIKDSSIYQKVDFVIDPDPKFVNRFKSKKIDGHILEKL